MASTAQVQREVVMGRRGMRLTGGWLGVWGPLLPLVDPLRHLLKLSISSFTPDDAVSGKIIMISSYPNIYIATA